MQNASRFIVAFLVSPIIIRGLGHELYGALLMIQQTVGYLSLSDMRPMATLKLTLGVRQHLLDYDEKRRQIGSALRVWAYSFPLFVVLGCVSIWIAPHFIRTSQEHTTSVRVALGIVFLGVAMDRVLSLPANVLRGMNMEYRAMGLNALTVVLGGVLSVLAISGGYGLPGVALATVIGVVFSNAVRYCVARSSLPWFGSAKPSRNELREFAILSGWQLLYGFAGILLSSTDLLLVGYFLGTPAVTVYATTGLALRIATEPLINILISGSPGISGLCGQCDWQRLMRVRNEMFVLAVAAMALIGAGCVALNESFLGLWLGDGYYAGDLTNCLLVLVALLKLCFRVDVVIISAMMELRKQALAGLIGGICVALIGGLLCPIWGLSGMALGSLIGYATQCAYFQYLVFKRVKMSPRTFVNSLLPLLASTIVIFALSAILASFLSTSSLWKFILQCVIYTMAIAGFIWFLGFRKEDRHFVLNRFNYLKSLLVHFS